jgi:replicative DNA helicase
MWEAAAERVSKESNDIIAISDIAHCSVDHVYSKTVKYEPEMVAVDYITLMDTSRSVGNSMWEKVTYLTQALKHQSRTLGIPMIGVAQTNIDSADEGAALQNIAYSRSIGQDSDLVIGLHQSPKMRDEMMMEARLLKNRDGSIKNTQLLWDMERMYFRPWNEVTDIFNRPGADDGADEAVPTAFDTPSGDKS